MLAAGDEGLGAVDYISVAVVNVCRAHTGGVGAGLGLGERESHRAAVAEKLGHGLDLVLGAEETCGQGAHEASGHRAGKTGVAAGKLFLAYRVGEDIEPHPAVLFGQDHGGQTHFIGLLVELLGENAFDLKLLAGGDYFLIRKAVYHLSQILLIRSQKVKAGCRHICFLLYFS